MRRVELTCSECGKLFSKEKKEYDRRVRKGATEFFCGGSCAQTVSNRKSPRPITEGFLKSAKRIKSNYLSPFRRLVSNARQTRPGKRNILERNITPEYLHSLWVSQGGRCPLTGWELILPENIFGWGKKSPAQFDIYKASLDRLDNNIGYVEGNLRFVSRMANLAKNIYSDEEVIKFAKAVAEHNKS